MGRAMIIAAAEAPYTRHPRSGVTTSTLIAQAAAAALRQARMEPADIDGLAVSSFSLKPDHAIDLAWRLGLRLSWLMEDTNGGACGINMLQHAVRAIEAGDCESVLLLAGDRLDKTAFADLVDGYNTVTRDHLAGIPLGGPNALFALVTLRHMREQGLERAHYGKLVVAQREWATLNPGAVYRSPMTLEDYLAAPMVAEPLCRYDCVPVVAGADAVLVTSSERAGRRPGRVAVRALRARFNDDQQEGDGMTTGLEAIADRLWSDAGADPSDIDFAQVYDDYPVMVLAQLRDMGVARGALDEFIERAIVSRALPVNTSGGQLSAGQASAAGGMHGLVEAVVQLRRAAGARQVAGARLGLVTGYGMVAYKHGACANAAVLERVVA